MPRAKLTLDEFQALASHGVPYVGLLGCRTEVFEAGRVVVRLPWQPMLLRPGGSLCGPAMMALADITLYGVVLSRIGRVELAVTTDLAFHFLSKPRDADLLAEGRLLRLGRTLAVGEVTLTSDGGEHPVAHCVGTYAIPQEA
ncbi:MAG: PaaI family thioesterase [Geminicoccaceae bacterium]